MYKKYFTTKPLQHLRNILAVNLLLLTGGVTVAADNNLSKLLYLVIEDNTLIASNIKFNRFDELKLFAREVVENHAVGNAVAVVVTNKRIIAYSVFNASWESKSVESDEELVSIEAEDYSALVVTSKRFLSFNGKSAVWAETPRSKIFR